MDLQRSLLIGAIAVLSFMLLTEWVAFKGEKDSIAAQDTTRLISSSDSELPDSIVDTSAAAEDLPEVAGIGCHIGPSHR